MKTVFSTIIIASAVLLSACNGQNPFKRQSNPIKDYPGLSKDMPESQVPKAPPQEPQPTQSLCSRIFNLDIEGKRGSVLKFTAGKPSQINVVSRWYPNSPYSLQIDNPPKGMTLSKPSQVSKDQNGVGLATWTVSWNPSKKLVSQGSYDTLITFRFVSTDKNLIETCGSDFSTDFTALVTTENNQSNLPDVSIEGLPSQPVSFGENLKFKVIVTSLEPKDQPTLAFGINTDAITGEQVVLSAENAVGCAAKPTLKESNWIFNCEMATDRIVDAKSNEINKWLDSGALAKARFDVVATMNGEKSNMTPGIVSIQFAEGIKAPATETQTKTIIPIPKQKPVQATKSDKSDVDANIL